jgi:hypothetical protein
MKKFILITTLFITTVAFASDSIFTNISNFDAQIFIDRLLRLKAGKQGLDGYREWSAIFEKFTEPLPEDYERMAAFQLFSFISVVQAHSHPSEMATEITLNVFEKSPELFIKVLENNKYMAEVICRKLLRSVSLHKPGSLDKFIDKWKPIVTRNLRRHKPTCEKIFDEYKSNKRDGADRKS